MNGVRVYMELEYVRSWSVYGVRVCMEFEYVWSWSMC